METIEKKKKCHDSQVGRIVISKGTFEKRIYPNQLNDYLEKGWSLGRKQSHRKKLSEINKNKIPWNKNTKGVMKRNSGTWVAGQRAWNKGKSIINLLPDEVKNDIIQYYLNSCNSIVECAKHFNVKNNVVYRILLKAKVIRTPKEASDNQSPDTIKMKLLKDYMTKKEHKSFNTSRPEEQLYIELLEENIGKTIYRQYKDPIRYPFYCDFYIKEDDLFIELNNHWTHGGHPFDSTNPNDQKILAEWTEKAKKSKFYRAAIITWTIRDVEKRRIAEENNLNYRVIY